MAVSLIAAVPAAIGARSGGVVTEEHARTGQSRTDVVASALPRMPRAPLIDVRRTVRVPRRIDSDGSSDVTRELTRFIRRHDTHTKILFPDRGRFRVEGTLWIRNANDLVIDGNRSTIFATSSGDRERRHVRVYGGRHIVITQITVRGANPHAGTGDDAWRPDREAQHGFELDGVRGVTLDDVAVFDVYGDFIYLGYRFGDGGVRLPSTNVRILRSHLERNGRQGITPNFCEDVLIRNNYIGEVRRSIFDLEPPTPSWGCDNVRIIGNTTGDGRLLWLASGGEGDNVTNVLIARNTMLPGSNRGAVLRVGSENNPGGYRGPFVIRDNRFVVGSTPWGLFTFRRVQGVAMHDNIVRSSFGSTDAAVMLFDSHDVEVIGNTFDAIDRIFDADGDSSNYSERHNRF